MPASQHQTERRSLGPCKGTWALWTLVTSALCFEEDHTPARQQEACGCVTYEKDLLRLSHYPRLTAANLVMPKNNGPPLRFQVGRCRVVDNWPSQLLYHGWHCVHSKHSSKQHHWGKTNQGVPSVPVLPLAADTAACKQVAEHTAGARCPQQGGRQEHSAAASCKTDCQYKGDNVCQRILLVYMLMGTEWEEGGGHSCQLCFQSPPQKTEQQVCISCTRHCLVRGACESP